MAANALAVLELAIIARAAKSAFPTVRELRKKLIGDYSAGACPTSKKRLRAPTACCGSGHNMREDLMGRARVHIKSKTDEEVLTCDGTNKTISFHRFEFEQ